MTTGTFSTGLDNSWAGNFVQAADLAAKADRRDTHQRRGREAHRPSNRGWARLAVAGLLIAVSAAGVTLVAAINA